MEEQWSRRKAGGDEAEERGEGERPSLQQLPHCLARQGAPAQEAGSWRGRGLGGGVSEDPGGGRPGAQAGEKGPGGPASATTQGWLALTGWG